MLPPLTGVAVKVTGAPPQIVVLLAEIDTPAGAAEPTVIVMLLEVADAGVAHGALLVMIQLTTSVLANVALA